MTAPPREPTSEMLKPVREEDRDIAAGHWRDMWDVAMEAAPAMTAPPREPTQEMLRAGRMVVLVARLPEETPDEWIARFYRAMYDAAPAQPVAQPAEPRHLTRDEQAMLGRALRKSARRISPDVEAAMPDNRAELYEPPAPDDLDRDCDIFRNTPVGHTLAAARALIARQARDIADAERSRKRWIRWAAEVEADRDALRECVRAADAVRADYGSAMYAEGYKWQSPTMLAYDAARAKVKP